MILIADSGATKTEWRIINGKDSMQDVVTAGINPHYQSSEAIVQILEEAIDKGRFKRKLEGIYFYGAGISSVDKVDQVKSAIEYSFVGSRVKVETDVLGVARALCGREPGMIGILGTGSAACQYDGKAITYQVPSLGFILGDEGSGAHLGKLLVAAYLRNELAPRISEQFYATHKLTKESALREVNVGRTPSRYLGSLARFLKEHLDDPFVYQLVYSSFDQFINKNVLPLPGNSELTLHFCGGTAFHFSSVLTSVCKEYGISIGQIVKSPLEGLTTYHLEMI